jgi:hypothetical protein
MRGKQQTHPVVLLLGREGLVGEINILFYILTAIIYIKFILAISLSLPKREF